MKTCFTLLNSDSMTSAHAGRLTVVMSEHIQSPPPLHRCVIAIFSYFTGKFNLISLLLTCVWCYIHNHCRNWGISDYPTLIFHIEELLFMNLLSLLGNASCSIFFLACLQRFLCEDLSAPQSSVKSSAGAGWDSPEAGVALPVWHPCFLGAIP